MVDSIRKILRDTLQLGARADQLTENSPLLGAIPEFDSMAVVTVLTMVEEDDEWRVARVAAVPAHRPDLHRAAAVARERDPRPVGRPVRAALGGRKIRGRE